ncbi:MAG: acetylglutamate kinase [Spirochaetia bacterium]
MSHQTIVVKIGGRTLAEPGVLEHLVADIQRMSSYRCVLVHGGGDEVTGLAGRLGITSEFVDGIRMTGDEEMDAVDMVLSGLVNKRVARRFQAAGVSALGMCASDGGTLVGEPIPRPDGSHSRTGRVKNGNPALLEHVLTGGYVAVVASTFMDRGGAGLNLNADDAALEIAKMLSARALLFLSDVPGILAGAGGTDSAAGADSAGGTDSAAGAERQLIPRLSPAEVESRISDGSIGGGMIPKVRSSVGALHAGVGTVIIGSYTETETLERMIDGQSGTRIEQ